MELIKHHHHFKKELIEATDRVAKCERYVVDLLLTSSLPDSQRESSIPWELKHHAGVTQMARLLARKRDLPLDVCTVGSLLHDIYVIIHGKYADHAHLGAPIALEIMSQIGGFSSEEVDLVHRIVYHHSDKHIISADPFQEFGKDADILDIFLYPSPFAEYLLIKSLPIFYHYLARAKSVWDELGVPQDPRFDLLRNYNESWFECLMPTTPDLMQQFLAVLLALSELPKQDQVCPPAFSIGTKVLADKPWVLFRTNRPNWEEYVDRVTARRAVGSTRFIEKLGAVLSEPLGRKSHLASPFGSIEETDSNLISEITRAKAGELISKAFSREVVIQFWPLADVYEFIEDMPGSVRLKELGITGT